MVGPCSHLRVARSSAALACSSTAILESAPPPTGTGMAADRLAALASAIGRHAADDGSHDTAVPALWLYRCSAPTDLAGIVYEPSLCLIAQGAKEVFLARQAYRYDPAQSLLVSVDLPVSAR